MQHLERVNEINLFDMDVARPGDAAYPDDFTEDWEQPRRGGGIWPYIVAFGVLVFILSNLVVAVAAHP